MIELTEAGHELLPQLTRGFDHFARAIGGLSRGELRGKLTVEPFLELIWTVGQANETCRLSLVLCER